MGKIRDILRTMDYGPSPESNDHVLAWLAAHYGGFGHFIDGAFTAPGALFEVADPATGKPLARVTQGTAADIDAAVGAARRAFASWREINVYSAAPSTYFPPLRAFAS